MLFPLGGICNLVLNFLRIPLGGICNLALNFLRICNPTMLLSMSSITNKFCHENSPCK